jgi:cytochrome P450
LADVYRTLVSFVLPFKSERLAKLWFGPWLLVFCLNPEDAKIVLNSSDCHDKPRFFYRGVTDFALVTINGDISKLLRKTITPLFTPKSLKSYVPIIDEVANEFLSDFNVESSAGFFDVSLFTLDFVLNSSLRTLFNMKVDEATRGSLIENIAG